MLAIAALAAALAVAPTFAVATPATPHVDPAKKPTIASVQRQLGELAVSNSQIVEQYNAARVTVSKLRRAATVAQAAARSAARNYIVANDNFTRVVQAQYESGGMTSGGALLASDSGTNYLDRLDTMRLLSSHDANVVTLVATTRAIAKSKSSAAATALATARAQQATLATRRAKVTKQIDKYQTLLATLNSAQQAAFKRANNPALKRSSVATTITVSATTAGARAAVKFALAQVGKPYVFGAAGPGSYDCSGLTMASWQHGGVSLPHSAEDQYNYGHHVARNALQPGDLLFFYQPIGHVTIYIGNGYMVSAPTEGEDVSVVPLAGYNADYVGATRLT